MAAKSANSYASMLFRLLTHTHYDPVNNTLVISLNLRRVSFVYGQSKYDVEEHYDLEHDAYYFLIWEKNPGLNYLVESVGCRNLYNRVHKLLKQEGLI